MTDPALLRPAFLRSRAVGHGTATPSARPRPADSPTPRRQRSARSRVLPLMLALAVVLLSACAPGGDAGDDVGADPPGVDQARVDSLLLAGDRDAVADLLEEGVDPVFTLVRAARVGAGEMVEWLLERGTDPNGALDDGFGSTALMAGASGNHPEVVPLLVSAGADLDQEDSMGDPALNWAAYMGQVEYARALVAAGARTDIRSPHGNAFEIALRQGWAPLIELFGAPADEGLSAAGRSLLAAVQASDPEAVAQALGAGASPELRTGAGIPVLAVAADAGDGEVVELLLESGASVDAPDPIGFTPLIYGARAGRDGVVRRLVAAGADPGHAAQVGGMGMTALHMAAARGRTQVVRTLLELGVPVDAPNARGETPLVWALTEGHPETGLVLLAAGADPDRAGETGYSPRQAARDYGYDEVVAVLEERDGSSGN